MNQDDFQRWLSTVRRNAAERESRSDTGKIPTLRVSNDRYAHCSSFEDRLTLEDRQMLSDMGIKI